MPRVTKSVTAKAKHKKVLNATKGLNKLTGTVLKMASALIKR